jgi:hypothetical protein
MEKKEISQERGRCLRKIRGKTTSRIGDCQGRSGLEMKIIIPNLFDGRERRGSYGEAAA